jgi:hypothetical protein
MRDRLRYFLESGHWKFLLAALALVLATWLATRIM